MMNSNPGTLVLRVTTLSTMPQPLPLIHCCYDTREILQNFWHVRGFISGKCLLLLSFLFCTLIFLLFCSLLLLVFYCDEVFLL